MKINKNAARLLDILTNPAEHSLKSNSELESFMKDKEMKDLILDVETGFEATAMVSLLCGPNPMMLMKGKEIYKSLGVDFGTSLSFSMSDVMDAKRIVVGKMQAFIKKNFDNVHFA